MKLAKGRIIVIEEGGRVDKKITSIEIKNISCGLCSADDIVTEVLKIFRAGEIKHLQYNGWSEKPVNQYFYKVNHNDIEAFFDLLTVKIKVQDWDNDYRVEVCDGWTWECRIRHSDKTIKKVVGTVEPPPRGRQLKKLIHNLTDYKVKPWIL